MTQFRVGTKVPINVYDGDRPVCQCHSPEQAAEIVEAVNFYRAARERVARTCVDYINLYGAEKAIKEIAREFKL